MLLPQSPAFHTLQAPTRTRTHTSPAPRPRYSALRRQHADLPVNLVRRARRRRGLRPSLSSAPFRARMQACRPPSANPASASARRHIPAAARGAQALQKHRFGRRRVLARLARLATNLQAGAAEARRPALGAASGRGRPRRVVWCQRLAVRAHSRPGVKSNCAAILYILLFFMSAFNYYVRVLSLSLCSLSLCSLSLSPLSLLFYLVRARAHLSQRRSQLGSRSLSISLSDDWSITGLDDFFHGVHGEIWRGTAGYRGILRDTGRYREIPGEHEIHPREIPPDIRADTGRYGQIRADGGEYAEIEGDTGG